jgi:hypothetical protein
MTRQHLGHGVDAVGRLAGRAGLVAQQALDGVLGVVFAANARWQAG